MEGGFAAIYGHGSPPPLEFYQQLPGLDPYRTMIEPQLFAVQITIGLAGISDLTRINNLFLATCLFQGLIRHRQALTQNEVAECLRFLRKLGFS